MHCVVYFAVTSCDMVFFVSIERVKCAMKNHIV